MSRQAELRPPGILLETHKARRYKQVVASRAEACLTHTRQALWLQQTSLRPLRQNACTLASSARPDARTAAAGGMTQLQSPPAPAAAAAPMKKQPIKGMLSDPEKPVREVEGCSLPLYRMPGRAASSAAADKPAAPVVFGGEKAIPQHSTLDALLLSGFDAAAEQGLLRYDVSAIPTRVVAGGAGFRAQYNEGRFGKKRMTEFRMDKVSQPFDESKFNFQKVAQKEVLLQLAPPCGESDPGAFSPSAPAPASPSLVLINVSPIDYGHVVLVPSANDRLNQAVRPEALLQALQLAAATDNPCFRQVFNAMGAFGTVNHLHFQGMYLSGPMAIELAPREPLPAAVGYSQQSGVAVSQLKTYPVRALVFEAEGERLQQLAEVVGLACQRLTAENVPHNLFISAKGRRVFLYPNAYCERKSKGEIPEEVMEGRADPAGFEIGGYLVLGGEADYESMTQETAWRFLSYASLTAARFLEVTRIALGTDACSLCRAQLCTCCSAE